MIGQRISHYKVLEKIGEGGMGEVYLADDTSLRRKVALKFLPDYLQQDEVAQKRFLREARSAAALDHPFICHIHEIGEVEGRNFIAMEYVKGTTLQERLLHGRVPLGETLRVGTEVAEALEEAHQKGIVHRDLKPSNIMLTPRGHTKVMDFGLAKRLPEAGDVRDDITAGLTQEGTTLGTLAYMSPEQTRGKAADTCSDIFSFGIVLYEMLTGVHPFRRDTQVETSNAILNEQPAPLDRYTEDTSDLLQHTLEKMLAKDPDQRYQSIHEVWTNLNKLSEKLSAPGIALLPVTKKRSALLGTGAFVALLVAVVLAVYLFLPGPRHIEEAFIDSIAVLPFTKLSEDEVTLALADGIPASIGSGLMKVRQVKVKPAAVLVRYKGTQIDPQQVAEEQNVSAVLMGNVAKRGNTLVVEVYLIDGRDNTQIWSKLYSTPIGEIFTVQDDISRQVAEALRLQLTDQETEIVGRSGTEDPEAYQDFMLGQHHFLGRWDLPRAITYFESAIAKDPKYQEAYAWLSQTYFIYARSETQSKRDWESARDYAEKGAAVDGSTATGHELKGLVLWSWERRWREAEKEYERVTQLGSTLIATRYIAFLKWMGRREEYVAEIERQLEHSDPLSEVQQRAFAWHFLTHGDWDRAIEQAEKARTLDPQHTSNYLILQKAYEEKGMAKQALEARIQGLRLGNASEERIAAVREAFEESGLEGLKKFDSGTESWFRPIQGAVYFAELGEKYKAFEWLEKSWSWDLPLSGMEEAPTNPAFDSLRDDPRFEEILRKQNLPEDAIQRHLSPSGS